MNKAIGVLEGAGYTTNYVEMLALLNGACSRKLGEPDPFPGYTPASWEIKLRSRLDACSWNEITSASKELLAPEAARPHPRSGEAG